jgi:hypothetical protein
MCACVYIYIVIIHMHNMKLCSQSTLVKLAKDKNLDFSKEPFHDNLICHVSFAFFMS